MTTLIETIKKDQLQARKNKDATKASLLTTLLGEASMIGKNDGNRESTDAEVIAVIKKFVKNTQEVIRITGMQQSIESREAGKVASEELRILESYLPKQLSENELRAEMQKLIAELNLSGPKGMGILMKEMKARFEGTYDGGLASKIAKEVLG